MRVSKNSTLSADATAAGGLASELASAAGAGLPSAKTMAQTVGVGPTFFRPKPVRIARFRTVKTSKNFGDLTGPF
jgi:hypothetical protein